MIEVEFEELRLEFELFIERRLMDSNEIVECAARDIEFANLLCGIGDFTQDIAFFGGFLIGIVLTTQRFFEVVHAHFVDVGQPQPERRFFFVIV